MTSFTHEDLAAWAERKRVRAHLTDGRADPQECTCATDNCLAAQAVADHLRACQDDS
jgi:hypothetical protein